MFIKKSLLIILCLTILGPCFALSPRSDVDSIPESEALSKIFEYNWKTIQSVALLIKNLYDMPDNYVYVKDEYREKYRTMINEFETTIKENYYRLHRHDSSIYRVITGEDMFINTDEQLEIISDCVDLFEKFILQMREDDFKREYQQRFVTFKSIAEESRQQYNNLKKAVYFWIDTFKDTPKRIEFDRKYATQQSS